MKKIAITVKGREMYMDYIKSEIPDVIVSMDNFSGGPFKGTAWLNYLNALRLSGEDPVLILEDDVLFCDDFLKKVQKEIAEREDRVIQFFSMRKDDLSMGSREISGGDFAGTPCVYFPAGFAKELLSWADDFVEMYTKKTSDGIAPTDTFVAAYLKHTKKKYWNVVPNLVEHRPCISAINPKRSRARQSFTFLPKMPEYKTALGKQDWEAPGDTKEFSGYDGSDVFRNDIRDGLTAEYDKCDVFYTEPAWMVGLKKTDEQAGEKSTYPELMMSIGKIIREVRKPFIIMGPKQAAKYLPRTPLVFESRLRHGSNCYAYCYRIQVPEFSEATDILEWLAQRYKCVGDFCCGYGLTGWYFRVHGKNFVMSDYVQDNVDYIKNLGWEKE